ncbi:MAG: S-adenosylmethionine:tRNA ribosyltransferase-isomerase, partial [Candidatus Kapaibacterium sp.]
MNELRVDEFDYSLPAERIAARPLPQRDASRLLLASEQSPRIEHRIVRDLPDVLPEGSLLIMNNSRVVPARLHLKKTTGGAVEVFLLEPEERGTHAEALARSTPHRWRCMLGGKGIQPGTVLSERDSGCVLEALIVSRDEGLAIVEFSWPSLQTFSEILHRFGATPLPPYIKRDDDDEDKERYQTVYARISGSVAAPTAGLHVSQDMLERCAQRNIRPCDVTLHIGLGTFEPMREDSVKNHAMHVEYAAVEAESVRRLLDHLHAVERDASIRTVCIGTTSLRTSESLYHLGRLLHERPDTEPAVL